ncbi:MAG: thiamine-binding protein [Desulfurococcales archaeon]|nr:thiamine-binding protein [Desulfurococcales archaeon]
MPIVSFKVVPITGERSVSKYVAEAVKVLVEEGFDPIVTPDTTVISLDDLTRVGEILGKIHDRLTGLGVNRVVTIVMVDDRRDKPGRHPLDLVKSVESMIREGSH